RLLNRGTLPLHCVHRSDRRRVVLSMLINLYSVSAGKRMSTLDEITKEKQRIGEALARVEAQREKLTGQLSELEAAERVLARYSKGTPARKTASAKTPTT